MLVFFDIGSEARFMSRVTVVGAGFGALNAIRALRKRDASIGIDLVAPRPVFVYYPGTIWIPTGRRRPEQLEIDLRSYFKRRRVRYHEAAAIGLSDDGRRLVTSTGQIDNDALIIACGGSFLDRTPGLEHTFLPCGGVDEIARLRDRLQQLGGGTLAFGFASNPDEPSAMRGGPVFEFLFGIETWLRRTGKRDRFRLVFFSPAERPGQRLGGRAVDRIVAEMDRRGIEKRLGEKPERFEPGRVVTSGGEFESELTVFMPGLTGHDWFDATPLARSSGGLLQADEYCLANGAERVYVVGDAGSYAGPDWLPKQGHTADLQARAAARNALEAIAGAGSRHRFKPELVCIVDMLDKAMLITRSESNNRALPPLRVFHWIKRAFEWNYTRPFR
jgi:sulfide:quinone oxidoreductase